MYDSLYKRPFVTVHTRDRSLFGRCNCKWGKEYFQMPLRLSNAFPHSYQQGHCLPLSVHCSCTVFNMVLLFSSPCCIEEGLVCETVSLSILASSSHHLFVALPIFSVPSVASVYAIPHFESAAEALPSVLRLPTMTHVMLQFPGRYY